MDASRTLPLGAGAITVRSLRAEVVEGPDAGTVARSRGEALAIGTADHNELRLTDPTVSRFHAALMAHEHGILVVDQGSTNGCVAGGMRLERAILPPRSRIRLGRTTIQIDDGEAVTVEALEQDRLGPLVGRSPVMRRLMAQVSRVGPSDGPVLLHGETGAGKEVVARALHETSRRARGPFEVIDCGALLPELVASELFGHEKGAFTGADRRHLGAFERARGGTVFLDEIGELSAALQVTLLGVLERRAFRRVGGQESIATDVRVVAATHRDLRREVNAGRFRQDLYYRLAVVTLTVPPLRERKEDIPLLVEHFLELDPSGGEAVLTPAFSAALAEHDWPGNVRELRNAVEAARMLGEPPPLLPARADEPSAGAARGAAAGASIDVGATLGLPYTDARDTVLDRFEAVYLEDLIARAHGNVTLAARLAKMNRTYLTRLMKRRGLERPE